MSAKVTKAERLLNALAKSPLCELTAEGAEYVKQRFDPYHDTPMKPVGYPDSYDGHTIARAIKRSTTFNATSGGGVAPTTTWDAHIVFTPLAQLGDMKKPSSQINTTFSFNNSTATDGKYGSLMMLRSDTDAGTWTYPTPTTRVLGNLQLTDDEIGNMMRVTAIGFEVIDGTAELYRQGILTAYRQNEPQSEEMPVHGITSGGGAYAYGNYDGWGRLVKAPPGSVADAVTIPDTKQWKVAEGAYVDIDFNDDCIPMVQPYPSIPCIQAYDNGNNADYDGDGISFFQAPSTGQQFVRSLTGTSPLLELHEFVPPNTKTYPINQSGIILTGLNPQANITVNCIWYVECAPGGEDTKLLTLASQSPAEDIFARMLISKLRRDSPVAVKLRENYMGEWFFTGVKDLLQNVAPWIDNASVISKQAIKWIDQASTNNGYINPQTFVKGDVAKKIMSEKKPSSGKGQAGSRIPKAPGPAPKKVAFINGKPVKLMNKDTRRRIKVEPNEISNWKKLSKVSSHNQNNRLGIIESKRRQIDRADRAAIRRKANKKRLKATKRYPNPNWNT